MEVSGEQACYEPFAFAEAERVCLLLQLHGRLAKGKGMKLF